MEFDEWVRACSSGLCEVFGKTGTFVEKGAVIAHIFDPFGTEQREKVYAPFDGVIIGRNNLPILNEGEPILQIAQVKSSTAERIKDWSESE